MFEAPLFYLGVTYEFYRKLSHENDIGNGNNCL